MLKDLLGRNALLWMEVQHLAENVHELGVLNPTISAEIKAFFKHLEEVLHARPDQLTLFG